MRDPNLITVRLPRDYYRQLQAIRKGARRRNLRVPSLTEMVGESVRNHIANLVHLHNPPMR